MAVPLAQYVIRKAAGKVLWALHLAPFDDGEAVARMRARYPWLFASPEEPTVVVYTGEALEGRRFTYVWTRLGDDVCNASMTFLRMVAPGGPASNDWETDDPTTTVFAQMALYWINIKNQFAQPSSHSPGITLDRIECRRVGVGVGRPNPLVATFSTDEPATGDDAELPPQVAISVTLKTQHRRSWGRFYLPAPVKGVLDGHGRLAAGDVELFRTELGDRIDSLVANNPSIVPVIWRPRFEGHLLQSVGSPPHLQVPDDTSDFLSVDTIQVDDVLDVIRSRRWKHTLIRETHTVPTP